MSSPFPYNKPGYHQPYSQTDHGFVVRDPVVQTASGWVKADADDPTHATLPGGIVTVVVNSREFIVTHEGLVEGFSGLTPGERLYVSSTGTATPTWGKIKIGAATTATQIYVDMGAPRVDRSLNQFSPAANSLGVGNQIRSIAANGSGTTVAGDLSGNIFTSWNFGETWFKTTYASAAPNLIWSPRDAIFVAAGVAGDISTSPDGITWTSRLTAPQALNDVQVFPEEGLYIAVGEVDTGDAMIYTSTNGTTWTLRTSGEDTNELRGVCFDPASGYYVVMGDGPIVYRSTDGTTWVAASDVSAITNDLTQCKAYNGTIIAATSGAEIARSTDGGDTWSSIAAGDETRFPTWSYLLDQWLIVDKGGIYLSPDDGLTWNWDTPQFVGHPDYLESGTMWPRAFLEYRDIDRILIGGLNFTGKSEIRGLNL